jgi:NAD(P)-dependent dehydrogenase (short-subunit alcohol dehydrogenase family)
VTGADLDGRRALVTGGAGGIGMACARLLLAAGARVVLLDRDAEALRDGAAAIPAETIVADVTDPESVARAVSAAADALDGPVDALVNAAGIYRIAPALDVSLAEWEEVLAINLRGTFLASRAVAESLAAAATPGAMVNLASTAGLVADADEPTVHYNSSKAGVIALTKQLAVEWAPLGIRVNAVCPGVIDTPMLRLMDDQEAGRRYLQTSVPLRRLGAAEEVAAVICFLLSESASYVTGVALPIDGGATAL